nr:sarcolemmal membrane-associated protein [Onthophagus taurus]
MVVPTAGNMSAKAVLICRPNSHPFQDRTLCLDQPVKVGRSVARAKATQTNAIFDCKVLSRHHAVLWYSCGKFYLQDTKSSNGTFVNNNRLSSKDSESQEVSSGDIVQFGVDVVENSNRKVTHGCIIAALKLYLPDGKEAKASPSLVDNNRQGTVPLEDLYELNQIIQEASQREQCLETKLLALQHIVDEARRSADESWRVYIGEERLLSRVAALEEQLSQVGKNSGGDRVKEELQKIYEDKMAYQEAAKESISKLLADQLNILCTEAEHQRARATAEQESMLARENLEKVQKEFQLFTQNMSEDRKKREEEILSKEQKIQSLTTALFEEKKKLDDLEMILATKELRKSGVLIENDDLKMKEDLIDNCENENENTDSGIYRTNGVDEPEQNHINKTYANDEGEVKVHFEEKLPESENTMMEWDTHEDLSNASDETEASFVTLISAGSSDDQDSIDYDKDLMRQDSGTTADVDVDEEEEEIEDDFNNDNEETAWEKERFKNVYSKTLKYQFQTAQNELKKQIENLEQLLVKNKFKITSLEEELKAEKMICLGKSNEMDELKVTLSVNMEKLKEACNESQQLKDKLNVVCEELKSKEEMNLETKLEKKSENNLEKRSNDYSKTIEHVLCLEEELVKLKEKFADVNEEKLVLNKEIKELRERYKAECDRSQNTVFFYVAPLVLILIYMLVSSLFS